MSRIQTLIQQYFTNLLLLFVAGGFLMLVAELLLTGHTRGIQLLAIVASVAGVVFALVGLFSRGKASMALVVAFLLLSVTGVIGVLEHSEERGGEREAVATVRLARTNNAANSQVNFQQQPGFRREEDGTPPPLAPLSLAGLSLIGAVTLVGRKEKVAERSGARDASVA
ncbi:hypothetical protein BH10CHL1_BH10CHL1_03800 [soil metagenome]